MTKSLTQNSIFYLLYNVLNVVFPFLTGVYVARVLLPPDIGQVETVRNLASFFAIFAFLGIPTYGLREISKARNDQKELSKLYSELMVINTISTIIFAVTYLVLIFLVKSYRDNLVFFLITGISIVLNFFNNSWLYEGLEKFDYISIRNFAFKVLSFLLLVLFVRSSEDYLVYAFITVVGTAGNNLVNMVCSRRYVTLTLADLNLKRHMRSILYLVVVNLAIEIYSMVDIAMLGLMCEKEVVTYYSYGMKIQKILLQVINTFTVVLVPRIALYFKEQKLDEYNALLTKTLSIILILSLPIIIGTNFIGDLLITKVYGDAYVRSSEVLKILVLAVCISPIGYLLGSRIMLVTGHESQMIIAVSTGAIINIIGNSLMIPKFQESGAAIASIASEIGVAVVYLTLSHKYFHLERTSLRTTLYKVCVSLAAMSGVLYLFQVKVSYSFLYTIVQIPLAIMVYFGILLFTREPIVDTCAKKIFKKFS